MATVYGQLQAFNPDSDSVAAYIERVHLFFAANDIPDKKMVPVFLSTVGGKTYELLRNLVSPKPPESFNRLIAKFTRTRARTKMPNKKCVSHKTETCF